MSAITPTEPTDRQAWIVERWHGALRRAAQTLANKGQVGGVMARIGRRGDYGTSVSGPVRSGPAGEVGATWTAINWFGWAGDVSMRKLAHVEAISGTAGMVRRGKARQGLGRQARSRNQWHVWDRQGWAGVDMWARRVMGGIGFAWQASCGLVEQASDRSSVAGNAN